MARSGPPLKWRCCRCYPRGYSGFRVANGVYLGRTSGRSISAQEWVMGFYCFNATNYSRRFIRSLHQDSCRRHNFLFVIKDSRGTKERNVRKCLGKISQLSFLTRIVLLGEKAQVVSHIKQTLEQSARFFLSTEEVPASSQPEGTWEKNTFTSR